MNYTPYLKFAEKFIELNKTLVMELWSGSGLQVELKADKSPVTNLDKQIELQFREAVKKEFPTHSVLGEEFGLSEGDQEFTWVIDPIDGTQSLINHVPTFGTFLALLHNFEPVLGIIDIPVMNRRVSGAVGIGVKNENGATVDLSSNAAYTPNDIIALGTPGSFAINDEQYLQTKLLSAFPTSRAYYDCFGHYLVAAGLASGLVELNVCPWDVVATEALVKAADGEVHPIRRPQNFIERRSSLCGKKGTLAEIKKVMGYANS